jgi:cytochrome c oxidase assembly factor CtaG
MCPVGGEWPGARSWAFLLGGLGSTALVAFSFLGVYDDTLFWVRAAQNVVLLMVGPMFLALGAPLTLVRELVSAPARTRLSGLLRSRAARAATFPPVVTAVLIAPLFVVYLTPLYASALQSSVLSGLVGALLVAAGFVYFWTRLGVDPTPRTDPHLVTVWITLLEVVSDGALGLTLWLGPLIASDYYHAVARAWGPDLRLDQVIGAGVLWIGGDLAGLPFLAVVLVRWMRDDQRDAARVDAELDAAADGDGKPDSPSGRPRLWWEDHPELAERFRRRP